MREIDDMRKFANFRPFPFFSASLITGILLSLLLLSGKGMIIGIIFICFAVFAFIIHTVKKSVHVTVFCLAGILFLLVGIVSGTLCIERNFRCLSEGKTTDCQIRGKVVGAYCFRDGDVSVYQIEKPTLNGKSSATDMSVIAKGNELEIGDLVAFKADVEPIGKEKWASVLRENCGLICTYYGEFEIVDTRKNFFETINLKIKDVTFENLGEESGVCYALLTGNVNYIDGGQYENIKLSGASHVFAVSGMHITFIVLMLDLAFRLLSIKRAQKATLVTLCSFLYAGVCGFTASAMRAVIMSAVALYAGAFGKKRDNLNVIALSAIIVLLINPMDLLSLGFQLSYACILSIELFFPTFKKLFSFMPDGINYSVSTCFAVFFGTTPLLCYNFGSFSVVTILLNLLLIPFITVFFAVLWFSVILVFIVPPLSGVLKLSEIIGKFFSETFALVSFDKFILNLSPNIVTLAFYYLVAVFASEKVNVPNRVRTLSATVPFPLFLLICL